MYRLGDLAERLGATLDPADAADVEVTGLATLASAEPGQLSFLANLRYADQLGSTCAAAVILAAEQRAACPVPALVASDPYLTFAKASQLFVSYADALPGVHASAQISEHADIHPEATVAERVSVGAGCRIGAGVYLGPGVVLGRDVHVGARSRIYANAVLYDDVWLGEDCIVHSASVLGADGFGFARDGEHWVKIAQLGGVRIGNRVEIGAGTTVDRGALDHTVIEDGVIIDNQVQIGHNCRVGKNTAIAGCSGLAGSTTIGANCTLAGAVGVVGHIDICDNVHIAGQTRVTKSITEPGAYCSGTPMLPLAEWKRNAVRFAQLDSLSRRLKQLVGRTGKLPGESS